jgi:tetratricopeptide (TPR) repeat protein
LASLQPNSPNVLNNLGVAYHLEGRLSDAVRVLQQALRLEPDLLSANLILGIDYVKLNEPVRAVVPLQKVLAHDPNHRDALFALASVQMSLKHFDAAAKIYQHDLKVRPDDADAWFAMGLCYEHLAEGSARHLSETAAQSYYNQRLLGEFMLEADKEVEAEEAFRQALSTAPGKGEGLSAELGFVNLRLGEVAQAEEKFHAELGSNPANIEAKLGLVAVAMEQQDWQTSAKRLCDVYRADSGFFRSRLDFLFTLLGAKAGAGASSGLAAIHVPPGCTSAIDLTRKESDSSEPMVDYESEFRAAMPPKPAFLAPDAHTWAAARRASQEGRFAECARALQPFKLQKSDEVLFLTRCQAFSGQDLMAFDTVRDLVKIEPENPGALYWQAEATRHLAQAAMLRAVSLKPDSWQGQLLLGDVYRQRKKWDLAVSHYESAARLEPGTPGPLLGIATVHWLIGQYAPAEAALQQALHLDPDNPTANFELGDVYVRMHRFEEAIPYLEKNLAQASGNLAAHGDLGKAYAALGRNHEAIAELTKALPSDDSGELYYQLYVLYKKNGETSLAQEALSKSEELRARDRENRRRRLDRVVGTTESSNPQD